VRGAAWEHDGPGPISHAEGNNGNERGTT